DEARQWIVRQRAPVAVVAFELVAVPAEEIGGLLHLPDRLHPILADLDRHRGGDRVDALLDPLGDAAQDGDPLRPGGTRPAAVRTLGRLDRGSGIVGAAGTETPEQAIPVDRRTHLVV